MSVAGGPPAFFGKPLSVVAYSPYRDGQRPGGAQPTEDTSNGVGADSVRAALAR